MKAILHHEKLVIPTYAPHPANPLPHFFEKKPYQAACGRVYPLPFTDTLSKEVVDKAYDAYIMENPYIKVTLLPELGGRIHGGVDKHNGYEFIYQNTVIKLAMIGLAGPWVSGGVEFNWAQHHRPTTFMPLEATPETNPDGSVSVWMGEAEPFHRMRGAVKVTVYPDRSYVKAEATVTNRRDTPLPFMWWNNLAVRVHEKYQVNFPPDVAWGCDHDRRAVISFPQMKGVYQTTRPFDYGDGTDASWFSNIKSPTSVMVMRGQSEMDFLGGYDHVAGAGTLTVSDHHTSVGKKMWTWGDNPFGNMWCANLTDNGDRYIELMTGVYTDNQPDFTYIMPGETKTFSQVWYPTHAIGMVKNATIEGALAFDVADNTARIGAITTTQQLNATLRLEHQGQVLLEQRVDISPTQPFEIAYPIKPGTLLTELILTLLDSEGTVLVRYQAVDISLKAAPAARAAALDPEALDTIEALYLNGMHLEQYKHHTYEPEAYYLEALRRDPHDMRCNQAMGRLLTEKGDYAAARTYLERSIAQSRLRNDNPADTENVYCLARLERLDGNMDKAYDLYQRAAWQYAFRSPSYYELACIDLIRGEKKKALTHLVLCLETNMRHYKARALLAYLQKDAAQLYALLGELPQDGLALFCLHLLTDSPMSTYQLGRSEDMTDIALDFAHAGLTCEAVKALKACTKPSQMLLYHLARLLDSPPGHMALTYCFPNRLEDIPALSYDEWQAQYLLGCLYYDRLNYSAAIAAWERAQALNDSDAFTKRCLALAYFDHGNQPVKALALMERALALAPREPRILFELVQMMKNMGASVQMRLKVMEAHQAQCFMRDDCFLDEIILYTQAEQYDLAQSLLKSKQFTVYEGGEGKLPTQHGWLYILLSHQAFLHQDMDQALRLLDTALDYPENYGEGRHFSAQEGNVYYYKGLVYEAMGDTQKAQEAFSKAANQPGHMTQQVFFTGLAQEKLGLASQAKATFAALVEAGRKMLAHPNRWGYFGVGMAFPLPCELNIVRINTIEGNLLCVLGLAGLKQPFEAEKCALAAIDPYNTSIDYLSKLSLV